MNEPFSRHIPFEIILNFRDLGGYKTKDGYTIAWRRVFRSGDLKKLSPKDKKFITDEIGLKTIIDLRSAMEADEKRSDLLTDACIKYYNIPFLTGNNNGSPEGSDKVPGFSNMGEFYLLLVKQDEFKNRLKKAIELIADPKNHPLVFHCAAGKDRTGVLAAFILSILNVDESTIIDDYAETALYIDKLNKRLYEDPNYPDFLKDLPQFLLEAVPESMQLFLSELNKEYGSVKNYLLKNDIDERMMNRIRESLIN